MKKKLVEGGPGNGGGGGGGGHLGYKFNVKDSEKPGVKGQV